MRIKTPWLLIFITIILTVSSFSLYFYIKRDREETTELRLLNWADQLMIEIAKDPDQFKKAPSNFLFSYGNEFISSGGLVQFMDLRGKILSKSPGLKRSSLPSQENDDEIIKDITMPGGTDLKIYQDTIEVNEHKIGRLVIGIPTSQISHDLTQLRWILAVFMSCMIVVLGFGINTLVSIDTIRNQKRFLSFTSHELRTPLTIISGHAEVALRNPSVPCRETLETIKEEADWMNKLVSNLLLMFRHQSGTQILNKTVFNLGGLITECATALKKSYPQINLTLKISTEAQIKADRDNIKKVINNLLENAARNSASDGKIQIELIAYPKYFELKVQDNGAGISQEHQKNIFDAFYQIEQGKGGSAGLGLAIAKWIIDAHRGHIRVESKPGKVTTFSVALPKK
jgi:signal transduction histidine kinase